jgi:hypothetical protein
MSETQIACFGKDILKNALIHNNVAVGATDYLDQIERHDFCDEKKKEHSFIRGLDAFGRPFVSFKIVATSGEQTHSSIITMFTRYSDGDFDVVCPSHKGDGRVGSDIFDSHFNTGSRVNSADCHRLRTFFADTKSTVVRYCGILDDTVETWTLAIA